MESNFYIILLFAVFIISFNSVETRWFSDDRLRVKLSHGGELVGCNLFTQSQRPIRAFLGIPYAQPPVGLLRFQSPKPYIWAGERLAQTEGDICSQNTPNDDEINGSEDCLYLNVYTPETPISDDPLPVIVWLHGGGWLKGSGSRNNYGPDFLLDRDIILVTANYRLGPLGFLSTETLDCPGNNALKDQVEVLKWVQKNIDVFGGNASSVTIAGQSTGGATVTYLLYSDQAKGLFHKAISQSGAMFNWWARPFPAGIAASNAKKVAGFVGCENSTSQATEMLDCLRSKSHQYITDSDKIFEDVIVNFRPVVEPNNTEAFLISMPSPQDKSHGDSVPLMIGATADEQLLLSTILINSSVSQEDFEIDFDYIVSRLFYFNNHSYEVENEISQKIRNFYFKDGLEINKESYGNLTKIFSDIVALTGMYEYVHSRVSHKGNAPTYVYLFNHGEGASASDDLRYLFPMREHYSVTPLSDRLTELRKAMVDMWVHFATFGNPTPNGTQLPTWEPTKSLPASFMRIGTRNDRDGEPLLKYEHAWLEERADFLRELNSYFPYKIKS